MNNTLYNRNLFYIKSIKRGFKLLLQTFISLLYRRYVNEVFLPEASKALIVIQDAKFQSVRLNSTNPWSEMIIHKGDLQLVRTKVESTLTKN